MRIFWAAIGILLIATAALIVIGADGSSERGAEPSGMRETGPSTPDAAHSSVASSGARTESRSAQTADPADEQVTTEVRAFNLPIDQVRKHFQAQEERDRRDAAMQAEIVERPDEPTPEPEIAPEPTPLPQSESAVAKGRDQEDVEPTESTATAPETMDQDVVDSIVASIMDEPETEKTEPAPEPQPPLVMRDERADAPLNETRDDDGRLLDGRFVISGAGTPDDPYVVNWSLLSSASETFDPRMGKTELPERIKMLNGAHVRITGFVAFPFMVQESSELLMMQNQWDGCCLGVPPTAYDAIEVTLKDPANRLQRMMDYGAVEGVLKVDPYVRGNWLISLYMMEKAKLAPEM
ncbi:MAG: DUF3299 domain-containing protein [Phycisphaeraceae bacterium]|nr:MAG: DUF3299 domain-containing protein [Phycisphaeraceae bacterium]